MCDKLTETLSGDKQHVICSEACLLKLQSMEGDTHVLSVKGRGEVKVTPDRVSITLIVTKRAPTVSEVNKLLVRDSNRLLTLLKEKSEGRAEKIHTDQLDIRPIYKEQTREEIERGAERIVIEYGGFYPITFEALIANMGALIDLSLKDDLASEVKNLSYIVGDAIAKAGQREALRLATIDAKEQADIVLDTLKLTQKRIIRIDIEDAGRRERPPVYGINRKMMMASAETSSVELNAPEQEIIAHVTLELSYV